MGVLEDYISSAALLTSDGILAECKKTRTSACRGEKTIHSVPDRTLQVAPLSLEDFLEEYLDENLLDSIEPGKLANLLDLVRSLKRNLADIMIKKGVNAFPIPSLKTIEIEASQSALIVNKGNITMTALEMGISENTIYSKLKE